MTNKSVTASFPQRLASVAASVFLTSSAMATSPKRVVALGDSLTEGYGVTREQAYPHLLQGLLDKNGYANVTVINAGVSGSTTASAVSRLRWQLQTHPTILILELGANDGLRGAPLTEIEHNLSETIALAQAHGVQVLLVGMKLPPNFGATYVAGFESIFPRLAKKYRLPLVPFMLDGVAGERALNQEDGIHPNEAGHRKVAETLFRFLRPLL